MTLSTQFIERLMKRVVIEPEDGCWLWTGCKTQGGYGQIATPRPEHKNLYTHRVLYEFYKGPIPTGLTIDHLCRVTTCCNPHHLEAVSNRTNILRGEGFAAREAQQTHCKRGHPLFGENVYRRPDRIGRECRKCRAVCGRVNRARRMAAYNQGLELADVPDYEFKLEEQRDAAEDGEAL